MISERIIETIKNRIREKNTIIIEGLSSISSKAFVISELCRSLRLPVVIVTDSNASSEYWQTDLNFFLKGLSIVNLPSFETDIYSGASPHSETQEERALSLYKLANNQADIVILSAKSMITRTTSPSNLLGLKIRKNQFLDFREFSELLPSLGYVFEDPVCGVGQFSIRGGIIDIWSPNEERPYRIEFFGDEIESIRQFNPETQLSTAEVSQATVAPMREWFFSKDDLRKLSQKLKNLFSDSRFERSLKDITSFADAGETFPGCEFLIPILSPLESNIFDYLPPNSVLIFDEPSIIEQQLNSQIEKAQKRYQETINADLICLQPESFFLDPVQLKDKLTNFSRIELRMLGKAAGFVDANFQAIESQKAFSFLFSDSLQFSAEISVFSSSVRKFHNRIHEFVSEIKSSDKKKVIVANSEGMAQRLAKLLSENGIITTVRKDHNPTDSITIVIGHLSSGFEIADEKLIFYTEADIFDELQSVAPPKKQKSNLSSFLSDFRDLKPGDYVVHIDHGVGRFEGLKTLRVADTTREFMVLNYADNATLLVPVERLDLVSRYGSTEGKEPSLDKLGSINWQKTKARVKKSMLQIADDLLKLYAERKLVKGFAFSKDTQWQKEFEDSFPFELTADQISAIEAVKKDMERESPMDRVIVGDVGYGKTEVAMRAAFKAVMDDKQVVVLTPTTVLAYQHFQTFKSRFAAFPITIELLSRFRSKTEQTCILQDLEDGKIDILIGTHRLLSSDVNIPKLGLLIVDEEQRFGVVQKEKLKKLKKSVDVLTLSATPIPRTLNMALFGLRDISIIETPPRDRLAINTQIVTFSDSVIKSAIELELSREGQVFFIHNRVETIEAIASKLKEVVPHARICVAHGQMTEKAIEKTMLDFMDYKYDVLVATTIIENGIDIPRANTIIINRADKYGLAQLYQLRGRVGRSNRRAYAYLLIPPEAELSPIARKRLSAIREFSDLGAGFRLAALDLELRGAGNLLGAEQSGHIEALGFELYMKMLDRVIRELQGEEIVDDIQTSIDLGLSTAIPIEYITETSQRLRIYKRITSAESEEELERIKEEIADRYGPIPESVHNLFEYRRLSLLAQALRITSIEKTGSDKIAIKFDRNCKVVPERLVELICSDTNLKFSPNGVLYVSVNGENHFQKTFEVIKKLVGEQVDDSQQFS